MVELKDLESVFCGIIVKSGDKHKDTVERPLRLTMAALDTSSTKNKEPITLCYEHNNVEYIICTLVPGSLYQQQIDLLFDEAEDIVFYLKGKGTVHLSGYYEHASDQDDFGGLGEDDEDESDFDESFINDEAEEDEEDEDDEEEEEEEQVSGKKRKLKAAEPEPKKVKVEEKPKAEKQKVGKPVEAKKNGDQTPAAEPSTKNKKKKNKKKKNKKNKSDASN